jgi:hypothetical protein
MAINVLFMASPLFMKAQGRNTACRRTKFHIFLESSMNRAALSRQDCAKNRAIAAHHFHARTREFGPDRDMASTVWRSQPTERKRSAAVGDIA